MYTGPFPIHVRVLYYPCSETHIAIDLSSSIRRCILYNRNHIGMMESEQTFTYSPGKRVEYFKKLNFRVKMLQSKEAVLVIVWSAMAMSVYYHVGVGKGTIDPVVSGGIVTVGMLLPIVGYSINVLLACHVNATHVFIKSTLIERHIQL